MAITLIAHSIAGSSDGLSVTTSGIDTTDADLVVYAVSDLQTSGYTLVDSKGNTISFTGNTYPAASLSVRVRLYYCVAPIVGAGHTATVTTVSGTSYPTICMAAFKGIKQTSPFDVQNGNADLNLTSLATGSITPSEDKELILTFIGGGSATGPYSVDSGFTILDGNVLAAAQHFGGALAYKIQTTLASINPTWNQNTSTALAVTVASFKEAAIVLPDIRLTQESIEVLTGIPKARLTQESLEVITGAPLARLSQESLEVLTGNPRALVSQVAVEVLVSMVPIVTQVPIEVLVSNTPDTDDSETLYFRRHLQDVRRNQE